MRHVHSTSIVNQTCQSLCDVTVNSEQAEFINARIREDYSINWLVDGLPAAEVKEDVKTREVFYDLGYVLQMVHAIVL